MGGNHASRWKFGKQFGNSRHRFFHGPGLNNFDMALLKTTKITESKTLEFRFDAFNLSITRSSPILTVKSMTEIRISSTGSRRAARSVSSATLAMHASWRRV